MGGDGRSRAQLIDNAHTIVRSDPGTTARSMCASKRWILAILIARGRIVIRRRD